MSTKNVLGRPWVEFVLGIDQVIKGFDRALPLMSVGERSTIIMSSEYACKLPNLCYFLWCVVKSSVHERSQHRPLNTLFLVVDLSLVFYLF